MYHHLGVDLTLICFIAFASPNSGKFILSLMTADPLIIYLSVQTEKGYPSSQATGLHFIISLLGNWCKVETLADYNSYTHVSVTFICLHFWPLCTTYNASAAVSYNICFAVQFMQKPGIVFLGRTLLLVMASTEGTESRGGMRVKGFPHPNEGLSKCTWLDMGTESGSLIKTKTILWLGFKTRSVESKYKCSLL